MSAVQPTTLVERFDEFLARYYEDAIAELAQRYPNEQRSLFVSYQDLYQFDADLAKDWREQPDQIRPHAEDALHAFSLPANVGLDGAHVRLCDLDDADAYSPGEFSPQARAGEYVAVQGQVARASEVYAQVIEAAFECQRCGVLSHVAQDDSGWQEPHECHGCERQGPFRVDFDQSGFVDGQKLRIQEPPERTADGNASFIDVFLEDDVVDAAEPGDQVTVAGVVHLEQSTSGSQKRNKFEPYMDGRVVSVGDTEFEDLEITPADEQRIQALAGPDIVDRAAASIAPGIQGEEYEPIKRALFLQLIGGTRAYADGTGDRGDFHQLIIGDPSTGKSALQEWFAEIAPRAVTVSGEGASKAGVTAAAVRDDFAEGGEWTLDAGALVQASGGHACIDELDKMPAEVRRGLHRAMEQQAIPINKAGINTTLPAQTAIFAAANPTHGRWDEYAPIAEQIDLQPSLVARFGLIWRLTDHPDEAADREIARTMLRRKESLKRAGRPGGDGDDVGLEPAIDPDLLRKYIAYARREVPAPVFADEDVEAAVVESFVSLRSINGYDEDAPVPVTRRTLPDVHRLAEAAARAELSETIEQRHVDVARTLIGESLRQYGMNEEGEYDADAVETGTTKPQRDRKQALEKAMRDLEPEYEDDGVPYDDLAEATDMSEDAVRELVQEWKHDGTVYEPRTDERVKWIGRRR